MIHFKNNHGFTLIEVLLAIAIVAMSMSTIFVLQMASMRSITRYSRLIERFIQAKNFFLESRAAISDTTRELVLEKMVKKPDLKLKYEIKGVSSDSPLKKFRDIRTEMVTLQWYDGNRERKDTLVTFIFKPESKKE
jgi:prepilin-type N-terminal cleavage/methylation domain-containing protein